MGVSWVFQGFPYLFPHFFYVSPGLQIYTVGSQQAFVEGDPSHATDSFEDPSSIQAPAGMGRDGTVDEFS